MFRRPWQVWTLFFLVTLVALPGLAWLSWKSVRLERAQELAQQRAEQEERVNRALWRMDSVLMPIVAREVARPYFFYGPVRPEHKPGEQERVTASLPPGDFVLLHFQWELNGEITSPQAPPAKDRAWALAHGADASVMATCQKRLTELQGCVAPQELVALLPEQMLPATETIAVEQVAALEQGNNQYFDNDSYAQQRVPIAMAQGQPRDLGQRNTALQQMSQQQVLVERLNNRLEVSSPSVQEGVSRPVWVGDMLLLGRRANLDGREVIQGCWLNWTEIHHALLATVDDLPDQIQLVPLRGSSEDVARQLVTLPVQMLVQPAVAVQARFTPSELSLLLAWFFVLLAWLTAAFILRTVVSLSERRAAFASAVSHELRTPLTTFRVYTEMLSQGMVTDPEARQHYLETLHAESNRLAHLVENVLSYARLERGRRVDRRESVRMGDLLDGQLARLQQRAQQGGMELSTDVDDTARDSRVFIEPAAVEQILSNLVDNSCKYASEAEDRRIQLRVDRTGGRVEVRVRDYGPGIATDVRRRMFQPFSKSDQQAANSAAGIGLGLAISRDLAQAMGGNLAWESDVAPGACFTLQLPTG